MGRNKYGKGWFKQRRRHSIAAKKGWQRRKGNIGRLSLNQVRGLNQSKSKQTRIADEKIKKYIELEGLTISKNGKFVYLYHGTNHENVDNILKNGLEGGYNLSGGNRGTFDTPTLFLSEEHIAEKYGNSVIRVKIPIRAFYKHFDRINDGLGDKCYTREGEGVLIPKSYLSVKKSGNK